MDGNLGLLAVVALAGFFWLGAVTAVVAMTKYRRTGDGPTRWLGALAVSVVGFGLTYWYLGSILGTD